jgi:hypothetical protein
MNMNMGVNMDMDVNTDNDMDILERKIVDIGLHQYWVSLISGIDLKCRYHG